MALATRTVFKHTGEDFSGYEAAAKWCKDRGYSVGAMQAESPIGLMRGDFDIPKWRNMSEAERMELDGRIEFPAGGPRTGDAVVLLTDGSEAGLVGGSPCGDAASALDELGAAAGRHTC